MTTRAAEQGAVRDDPPVPNDYGLVVRPLFAGGVVPLPVPVVTAPQTTTGEQTLVPANPVSVVLLAADPTRIGFSIRNMSGSAYLYVRADTTDGGATPTNATVELVPGSYYEDPYRYVGVVEGIWTGVINPGDAAIVTEYLPI